VLGVRDAQYAEIATLSREFNKPVWCMEAGHDSQLWQSPDPWPSWENALRTALAYEKTLRLTRAEVVDYWTYQNNYPLIKLDGKTPLPVWQVLRQMQDVFAPGSKVVATEHNHDELAVTATMGPKRGQFAAVIVNPAGAGEVTLNGVPARTAVQMSESTRMVQRRSVPGVLQTHQDGSFTVTVPARSVVTVLSEIDKNSGSN
jgi:hypothetical protein